MTSLIILMSAISIVVILGTLLILQVYFKVTSNKDTILKLFIYIPSDEVKILFENGRKYLTMIHGSENAEKDLYLIEKLTFLNSLKSMSVR